MVWFDLIWLIVGGCTCCFFFKMLFSPWFGSANFSYQPETWMFCVKRGVSTFPSTIFQVEPPWSVEWSCWRMVPWIGQIDFVKILMKLRKKLQQVWSSFLQCFSAICSFDPNDMSHGGVLLIQSHVVMWSEKNYRLWSSYIPRMMGGFAASIMAFAVSRNLRKLLQDLLQMKASIDCIRVESIKQLHFMRKKRSVVVQRSGQ